MTFTRPRDLVVTGAVAAVAVYLLLRLIYRSLPHIPVFAGVSLAVLALVEVLLAIAVRGRIRGTGGERLEPIAVARAVALAKASSLLGAIMLGAWVALLAYVLPESREVAAAADDVPSAIVGAVSAAALIAAALWLEFCCRNPDDRGERSERHPGTSR